MKKVLKLALFFAIGSNVLFFSCKEEVKVVSNQDSSKMSELEILIPNTAKEINESSLKLQYLNGSEEFEEFAKVLAKSLKDKEFRKLIKDEANKKFDGDYDILVSKIETSLISGVNFKDFLKGKINDNNYYEKARANNKLNISIPVLIEKWNFLNQIPLVAVAINAEEDTKYVKAFDSNGKVYLLDNIQEPNFPVIVIGENERMDILDITKNSGSNISSKNGRIKGTMCVSPFRINGKFERWKGMYLTESGLSNIEVWTKGAPEILVDIYAPTSSNWNSILKIGGTGGSKYEPSNRNDIKNKWWYGNSNNLDVAMFNWNTASFAKTIKFYFWERDEQTNTSKTISLSGSYKIPATQGFPETTVAINQTATYPGDSDTIFEQLLYQDDCPPYFEGTPLQYPVWGGTNVKVAMISF